MCFNYRIEIMLEQDVLFNFEHKELNIKITIEIQQIYKKTISNKINFLKNNKQKHKSETTVLPTHTIVGVARNVSGIEIIKCEYIIFRELA